MKRSLEISKKDFETDYSIEDLVKKLIKEKDSLKKISMHHFNEQEIEQLISALHCCLNLEELDLSENMTEDTQVPLLVQLINHLPKIKNLNVSHSFLSERGILALHKICSSKNIGLNISFSRMSHERTVIYQKDFVPPKLELRLNQDRQVPSSIPISPEKLITSIPHYQQDYNYDCGATAILNIVDYYNKILQECFPTPKLRELVNSIKTCELAGAEIENMIAWFESHNYEAMGGFGGTEDLLRHYTSLGIPVIINTNEWGGHYIVVIGFEAFDPVWPEKDKLWCCDPLAYQHGDFNPSQPYTKRNLLQFLDQWRDSKGREGGYIAAVPREIANSFPNWKYK